MKNAAAYIGLATFEIEIYAVDRREFTGTDGSQKHFNTAYTSQGVIMVSDEVYAALASATPATPASFTASGYVKDGAMRYNLTL